MSKSILVDLVQTSDVVQGYKGVVRLREITTKAYMDKLKEAAPYSLSHFVEYITPDEPPARHHNWLCKKLEQVEQREITNLLISMPPGFAKALALDTEVPTPEGPKTIEDLQVGDEVFSVDGQPVRITNKSEVFTNNRCFKVTTSDGRSVVCDADHLWNVKTYFKFEEFENITALELYERQVAGRPNPILPRIKAPKYERKYLGLPPYILGAWLVTKNRSKISIEVPTDRSRRVFSRVNQYHRHINKHVRCPDNYTKHTSTTSIYSVAGLKRILELYDLINDPRIPDEFERACYADRAALFDAIVDIKAVNEPDGTTHLSLDDEKIAKDFRRLCFSLGVSCTITHLKEIEGLREESWKLNIVYRKKAFNSTNPTTTYCDNNPVTIYLEEVESVPTQCIKIDSDDGLFLVGEHIPTHNTKFCSRYFPAWYLGRNENHIYLQGGHTSSFCTSEFGKVTRGIVRNPLYANVFPDSVVGTGSPENWKLSNGRGGYVTKGVGEAISGFRGNCGGVDDPFASRAHAESPLIRQKVSDWFFADFLNRFLPNSPVFVIATRWHPDDLIGRLEDMTKKGEIEPWETINLPAVIETDEDAEACPFGRKIGDGLWPEYYTNEMMLNRKATIPARDWNSLFQGKPVDEEGNLLQLDQLTRYEEVPDKKTIRRITVSVDSASKAKERNDYTVLTVWYEDVNRRHYLIDVIRRRVKYTELECLINDTAADYGAHAIIIEDMGSGIQYIQRTEDGQNNPPCPVIAIKTNNKSKEFRFDGVIPMIVVGNAVFPVSALWLAEFERELMAFPTGNYDDQVDSTSQYLNWVSPLRRLGSKKMNSS